jgi:hypothetical protein
MTMVLNSLAFLTYSISSTDKEIENTVISVICVIGNPDFSDLTKVH